ncbi:hypothetical protein [Candidatus Thiosymbion oneisti]|uniref:hypothetical protein n=1 Tax=Candidatus Thiosymbion oneisti TaxID=589554 RepID=UPI00105F42B5|nr:hypothetical protein [Candidatus Thiosymbion oneisti]
MATANSTRALRPFHDESIRCIRDALLIGLVSYGQIERLSAAQEVLAKQGKPVAKDLRVMHPTGTADTVSRFAEALWLVCG